MSEIQPHGKLASEKQSHSRCKANPWDEVSKVMHVERQTISQRRGREESREAHVCKDRRYHRVGRDCPQGPRLPSLPRTSRRITDNCMRWGIWVGHGPSPFRSPTTELSGRRRTTRDGYQAALPLGAPLERRVRRHILLGRQFFHHRSAMSLSSWDGLSRRNTRGSNFSSNAAFATTFSYHQPWSAEYREL